MLPQLLAIPAAILLVIFTLIVFLIKPQHKNRNSTKKPPPGPKPLPIIGNLHILGKLPHRTLQALATKYGPIMSLKLGQLSAVVVSSPEVAQLFFKTHDLVFANRPKLQVVETLSYGRKGMVFTEYGGYWRNVRKLCTLQLLSASKVEMFAPLRKKELGVLVNTLKKASDSREVVDLSELIGEVVKNITYNMILGRKKKSYACNSSSHGTTNLHKHLRNCTKNPHRQVEKGQKTITVGAEFDDPNAVKMKLVEFNQEQCRLALAKMIVIDELPFKFVEGQGFRDFTSEAQPRFKVPSRITVARDCMALHAYEKFKLRKVLSENHQMVSLTTDTWTSIQNLNYMCVTAHYIDDGWKLNKKILNFGLITNHKGETIGRCLEQCLQEWGIRKICCVIVDNASANGVALTYLLRGMADWNGFTILNGEYMHMRCCAHILNLIVGDGMKEIDVSISKIRTSCKFVRSFPTRMQAFKRCVQEANITSKANVVLDVPTRWNSTYLMLEAAEKFESAFSRLSYQDSFYLLALEYEGGPPDANDWKRARVFVKFLKIFYDATLSFSGSLTVTCNNFFNKLCDIQKTLNKWRMSDDVGLQKMATQMKIKLDKYWKEYGINYLLFVTVFLDPRYKLDYVEFCLNRVYGNSSTKEMLRKLRDTIHKLFEYYSMMYPLPDGSSSSQSSSIASQSQGNLDANNVNEEEDGYEDEFRLRVKKKQGEIKRNELERYMEDDVEDNIPG